MFYLPVLLFLLIALIIGIISSNAGRLVRPFNPYSSKNTPYECGLSPSGDTWGRNKVPYYIYGLLFLLFDVEILFLFPWAVVFHENKLTAVLEMLVFVGILFVAYIYAWHKGALDWE